MNKMNASDLEYVLGTACTSRVLLYRGELSPTEEDLLALPVWLSLPETPNLALCSKDE